MSDLTGFDLDHGIDEEVEQTARLGRSWQPHPWWAWSLGALLAGPIVLLVAGTQLAGADFGTSLRARGCDASPLGGIILLAIGAMLLALGFQLARLRVVGAVLTLDLASLVVSLPIPAALLAATLPGVFGCSSATDIARVGLVGDALVGTSGIAMAACAAALVGVALATVAHVSWLAPLTTVADVTPGIVELAIQEAEALEAEGAAHRFHGVDSGE
jgi:hypothetical protein